MSVTSAQGIARFHHLAEAPVQIRVLAAGFAEEKHTFSAGAEQITITLHPAVATETVVVLATRTPVSSDETGSSIALLTGSELETMHPVAANDALRFLPGAIVSTAGQRGGLGSLFVRGGDSRYNKVLVDGVAVNDPGGTFDFGTLPVFEADRVEFLRGAESTLYGSDAMTSVVQVESRTGATSVPELSFGADAGSYGTQNGYASLSGANSRFDYNLYGNQFNTSGSGPNADYSNWQSEEIHGSGNDCRDSTTPSIEPTKITSANRGATTVLSDSTSILLFIRSTTQTVRGRITRPTTQRAAAL
jgi:vitamin B12 transporter